MKQPRGRNLFFDDRHRPPHSHCRWYAHRDVSLHQKKASDSKQGCSGQVALSQFKPGSLRKCPNVPCSKQGRRAIDIYNRSKLFWLGTVQSVLASRASPSSEFRRVASVRTRVAACKTVNLYHELARSSQKWRRFSGSLQLFGKARPSDWPAHNLSQWPG